jgi:formylglycine-generating enzyme required for sulfatase activity
MSPGKGSNVEMVCLIVVMTGLLASCTTGARPETTATDQPSAVPSYNTPTSPDKVPFETRIRPLDQMTMVFVPGGIFQMGSTEAEVKDAIAFCRQHYSICNDWFYMRETPQHPVTVSDFWLDQTEVSNAQYRQCAEAGICTEPIKCKKGEPTYPDAEKSDHPVVCVGWEDARTYCEWAGARLPTEAEWEYAFRGKQNLIYPWGNLFDGEKMNYCDANCTLPHAEDSYDDGFVKAAPVGSYPQDASWCGALDMSGNISEWVADWSESYSSGEKLNPTGPLSGTEKILRGCNWYFQPAYCRGAARPSAPPDTRYDYLGFRCASSVH